MSHKIVQLAHVDRILARVMKVDFKPHAQLIEVKPKRFPCCTLWRRPAWVKAPGACEIGVHDHCMAQVVVVRANNWHPMDGWQPVKRMFGPSYQMRFTLQGHGEIARAMRAIPVESYVLAAGWLAMGTRYKGGSQGYAGMVWSDWHLNCEKVAVVDKETARKALMNDWAEKAKATPAERVLAERVCSEKFPARTDPGGSWTDNYGIGKDAPCLLE